MKDNAKMNKEIKAVVATGIIGIIGAIVKIVVRSSIK
jgi:hypothetical protein